MSFPKEADLAAMFRMKYDQDNLGWSPKLRRRFGYFTPADVYEAVVWSLVQKDTHWLDVGCGREIFPGNYAAAAALSQRCRLLVGVDPSDNIDQNDLLHKRAKSFIEDFETQDRFDVITARMVAEHITSPPAAASSFSRLCRPGGRVVIYTVYRWSPVTLISDAAPFALHHALKRVLWKSKKEDTFPTAYLMNTRSALKALFNGGGFDEEEFRYLDDCRSLARWKVTNLAELSLWKTLTSVGLHYPELCILGIYRKRSD